MDGLMLLHRAQEAGLAVKAEGDRLVIRGPKRAERIALLLIDRKSDVLAVLAPSAEGNAVVRDGRDASDRGRWCDRYRERVAHWLMCGRRPWQEAERLAYGELVLEWHRRYGAQPLPERCAGCGEDLPEDIGLVVDRDGARVHFGSVHGVDCILAFDTIWRGAAVAGLQALGLHHPRVMSCCEPPDNAVWGSRGCGRARSDQRNQPPPAS